MARRLRFSTESRYQLTDESLGYEVGRGAIDHVRNIGVRNKEFELDSLSIRTRGRAASRRGGHARLAKGSHAMSLRSYERVHAVVGKVGGRTTILLMQNSVFFRQDICQGKG